MISQQIQVKIEEKDSSNDQNSRSDSNTRKRRGNSYIYTKTGHWNEDQKLKYLLFIDHHYNKLNIKENRRPWKIFRAMSVFIGTRRPSQCRSHHLKMENYFESTQAIISYYKARTHNYAQQYERNRNILDNIQFASPIKNISANIVEEKISKNDFDNNFQSRKFSKRNQGNCTSIKVIEQEQQDAGFPLLKDIQKTDETIKSVHNIQIPSPVHINSNRPLFSYNFLENEILPYQFSFQFSAPTIQQQMEHGSVKSQNLDLFQPKNALDKEWMECHQLYLLWRSKAQALIKLGLVDHSINLLWRMRQHPQKITYDTTQSYLMTSNMLNHLDFMLDN